MGGVGVRDRDAFSGYHPAVNLLFFGEVLAFTMFFIHPAGLAVSFCAAVGYSVWLNGGKAAAFQLKFTLPMMVVAALVNPAFNHRGATILTYFPSGNPLTLESILYGLAAAGMLGAVVTWFQCLSEVMTADKFVYLFGRIIPAMSLVLSMTLRFVPRFAAQFREVCQAQAGAGRDVSTGPVFRRVRNALTVLSILITWSLENAIETADSMKSRGYGLPGRTAFSIYRFQDRDKAALAWLASWGFYTFCAWGVGGTAWTFFPQIAAAPVSPLTVSFWVGYLALCATPLLVNGWETLSWKCMEKEAA